MPASFLRQLISFYGDSMQLLVPRYLESSLDMLTKEQEKFRKQMTSAFGAGPFTTGPFGALMEDQVRRNMEMFERTFSMFQPFQRKDTKTAAPQAASSAESQPADGGDIDALRQQMKEMQERLERMSAPKKDSGEA